MDPSHKIFGLPHIMDALGFNLSSTTAKKRGRKMLVDLNVPFHIEGRHLFIYQDDVNRFRANVLRGRHEIAAFLGITEKTLRLWMRKYHQIPIKNKGNRYQFAIKTELAHWNLLRFCRKYDRSPYLKRKHAPSDEEMALIAGI